MQKILISIQNDTIGFSYKNAPSINSDLSLTNVINTNELIFSQSYIASNQKIISLFIKELCEEKNIHCAVIETNALAVFLFELFKRNQFLTAICIRENASLSFSLYEKIIENKNITYIEANSIPHYMVEMLDKKGVHSESRTEVFYPSHFMQSNNLTSFSKIFYKMNIRIDQILNEEDRDDFLAFCSINKYLKTIHLDVFNKNDLEFLIDSFNENRLKNIRILIYANIKDYKTIDYLKKLNRKIRKNKFRIELVYSKEYLKNNLFTQILMNTLKICGLMLMIMVVSVISYIGISNYVSLKQVTQIQENIKEIIEENTGNEIVDTQTEDGLPIKNNYIMSLTTVNSDVIGWLKVNNTNIDYPVVQAHDNDYYLKHNFDKASDKNGWIYMDYRNSSTVLDDNTIIFGHNIYNSGVMFGTLGNAYKKAWYTNPDNLLISFDTIYESNLYQIFSIYKVPKTTDYLKTYFADDNEFIDYVNLIKGRSINDFEIEVKPGDKILTLSTCTGDNQRLVVHARLIKPIE